ncbi:hypothetical protein PaecuDRAFT_0100 [Paenibacillus curdlanolyticus YK9]|uniref:Uncharacterized protein n=1 Tax=Paenibacillus curdlanolyticus YK9 TaxID=717606 RepID=E0I4Q8_9BACL|nr:hypothetical protein PaecuDRAFT_0100 [Paenibacillus curdlanolyticus YK9]
MMQGESRLVCSGHIVALLDRISLHELQWEPSGWTISCLYRCTKCNGNGITISLKEAAEPTVDRIMQCIYID